MVTDHLTRNTDHSMRYEYFMHFSAGKEVSRDHVLRLGTPFNLTSSVNHFHHLLKLDLPL